MPIQKSGQFQKYDFDKTKKSHFRVCFFGFWDAYEDLFVTIARR